MIQLNSLVESEGGKKQIKIRNFQALIDENYNHNSKNSFTSGKVFTNTKDSSQMYSSTVSSSTEIT
jgi:hypothetical protein